jgi:8-oxo-dGTP pyrophosphatase MutT (NUDIX family)
MNYVESLRKEVGNRPLILVGAVTILLNNQNQVLLQKRKTTSHGKYGLPGGLMELGESTEDTARREVFEETGLTVGDLHLVDIFSGPGNYLKISNGDECHFVTALYSTNEFEGTFVMDETESLEFGFFDLTDLPEHIVGSHRKMIQTYLTKQESG